MMEIKLIYNTETQDFVIETEIEDHDCDYKGKCFTFEQAVKEYQKEIEKYKVNW